MNTYKQLATSLVEGLRRGLKLVPSEVQRVRDQKARLEKSRLDNQDLKLQLESEVRTTETRILHLDAKYRREHGVLARTTRRELEDACRALDQKEKQIQRTLDHLADQESALHQLDLILRASEGRISADDWDALGVGVEERIALDDESRRARESVLQLEDKTELRESADIDVNSVLGEIRGEAPPAAAPAADDLLLRLRQRVQE